MIFKEGIFLGAGGVTSFDCLPLTTLASEVAATRRLECTDPTPAIAAGDFATHGGDMPLGPILIAKRLIASPTRPLLRLLVEAWPRLTADVGAHCTDRGGGGR